MFGHFCDFGNFVCDFALYFTDLFWLVGSKCICRAWCIMWVWWLVLMVSSESLSEGKGVSDPCASKLSDCKSTLEKAVSRVLWLTLSEATLFYSILFCTFIALNLCKADSKAQHQKSSLRNHLSIAVAKSSTTETPDRVYAKVGMPCGRDMILTFSWNGESWGRTYLIRQMIPDCGGIKSKAVAKVIFGFMYRWTELRNLQEPFIWMVVSCTISSATSG